MAKKRENTNRREYAEKIYYRMQTKKLSVKKNQHRGKKMKKILSVCIIFGLTLFIVIGCENPFSDDDSDDNKKAANEEVNYNPVINPADFVSGIDNEYFPLVPGTKHTYTAETDEGTERIEVYVTHQTKDVLGVTCVVVDDKVWLEDELIEATLDWYAQDKDGNVWYMGEDSTEYEDGKAVSTEGSWEAGVDGAKPGIIMMAIPVVGVVYRQEYYEGEAEDKAEVLSLNESITVPFGSYENCLRTKDWNPLDMETIEEKYYAQGIGVVQEVMVKGGNESVVLIDITTE